MAPRRPQARAVIMFCAAALLFSAMVQPLHSLGSDDDAVWTVMVYMAGDSEPELPWEEDVNEMESAALADWMNVIVLVDPLGAGDSVIFEIASDGGLDPDISSPQLDDSLEVIPADGEVDTASGDTLYRFITYCSREYPADRLALVLWGHSGGFYGLCEDGDSLLQLPDLGLAVEDATDVIGRDIDIVIVDSCAEGVVETMYELCEHVDWYVGSEIMVPSQGLDYGQVLDGLADDRTITPEDWGAKVCEIHRMTLLLNSWSATMSVVDLRQFGQFIDGLTDLSDLMLGYADIYRDTLKGALQDAASSDFMDWYLDTGDALRMMVDDDLPLELRYLALKTRLAYDDMVYAFESYASPFDDNYDDVGNCTGTAVYAPSEETMGEVYTSTSFHGTGWGHATSAIRAYEPEVPMREGPEVTYADTDNDSRTDEATLHWNETHEWQMAWVFVNTSAGLQLLHVFESSGADLVVSGLYGELMVSASAWDGGDATTHDALEFALTRALQVRVDVWSGGERVTEGIDVVVRTIDGPIYLELSESTFTGSLIIPGDARYGDLLTVDVLDGDGVIIAQSRIIVAGYNVTLEITYPGGAEDMPGPEILLPAMILIVAAAAVFMYLRGRKKESEL